GVVSPAIPVRVVWFGPAALAPGSFTRRNAVGPGATLSDSVRVVVTNIYGFPVRNAKVAFAVQAGGGSVSPTVATTGPTGIAATQWTLGPDAGINTVVASVVHDDGSPNPLVADNAVNISIRSYDALTIESGNDQTGQILADLPTAPAVRLVDSLGVPRAGVPVLFTAFQNGRVTTPLVSTDAN